MRHTVKRAIDLAWPGMYLPSLKLHSYEGCARMKNDGAHKTPPYTRDVELTPLPVGSKPPSILVFSLRSVGVCSALCEYLLTVSGIKCRGHI